MKSIKSYFGGIERETIVKHDIPKNYKCKYCSEFFASPQGLGSHLHNNHSTVETKQTNLVLSNNLLVGCSLNLPLPDAVLNLSYVNHF